MFAIELAAALLLVLASAALLRFVWLCDSLTEEAIAEPTRREARPVTSTDLRTAA